MQKTKRNPPKSKERAMPCPFNTIRSQCPSRSRSQSPVPIPIPIPIPIPYHTYIHFISGPWHMTHNL
jgi:hypothetical protein